MDNALKITEAVPKATDSYFIIDVFSHVLSGSLFSRQARLWKQENLVSCWNQGTLYFIQWRKMLHFVNNNYK